jgi:hypothetical protein
MKRALILFIAAVCALPLCADSTSDLLKARPAHDAVRIKVIPGADGKVSLEYAVDASSMKSLPADKTIRASDEIGIYLANFNPLEEKYTVNVTSTPDPNFAAIKDFLDDFKKFAGTFPSATAGTGGPPVGGGGPGAPPAGPCKDFKDLVDSLNRSLKPELDEQQLQNIAKEATGLAGVNQAKSDLSQIVTQIDINITTARTALQTIRADFTSLDGAKPKKSCPTVTVQMLIEFVEAQGNAERALNAKEALEKQIKKVIADLEKVADPRKWDDRGTDYRIDSATPTADNEATVNIAAQVVVATLPNGVITFTPSDSKAASKLHVRLDSFFVPERALAVVYNTLTYPQYGTAKDAAGKTVVARTKDHEPLSAAAMLNLIMRVGSGTVVNPMIQIGLSTAKDYPAILAGIGFRFTEPVSFSLSAGGMLTRYKDLDGNLAVGQEVSGTDDINKHLTYKNSPIVVYGAFQIKF